jgi:hypothetical protein
LKKYDGPEEWMGFHRNKDPFREKFDRKPNEVNEVNLM